MRRAPPITEMFMHIDDWWSRVQFRSPHAEKTPEREEEERAYRARVEADRAERAKPYEQRLRERLQAKRMKK